MKVVVHIRMITIKKSAYADILINTDFPLASDRQRKEHSTGSCMHVEAKPPHEACRLNPNRSD